MILEDDPNNDGVAEAIVETTQEAELEHILEVKGVLANISMSSKMSQESGIESVAETCRLRDVQSCVSTHLCNCIKTFWNYKISKFKNLSPKACKNVLGLLQV